MGTTGSTIGTTKIDSANQQIALGNQIKKDASSPSVYNSYNTDAINAIAQADSAIKSAIEAIPLIQDANNASAALFASGSTDTTTVNNVAALTNKADSALAKAVDLNRMASASLDAAKNNLRSYVDTGINNIKNNTNPQSLEYDLARKANNQSNLQTANILVQAAGNIRNCTGSSCMAGPIQNGGRMRGYIQQKKQQKMQQRIF
jgi:hypothetical protein